MNILNYLPTTTCTPWCTDGDGHPGETTLVGQACRSDYETGEVILPDGGAIGAYACRVPGGPARVTLYLEPVTGLWQEVALTETESAALLAAHRVAHDAAFGTATP